MGVSTSTKNTSQTTAAAEVAVAVSPEDPTCEWKRAVLLIVFNRLIVLRFPTESDDGAAADTDADAEGDADDDDDGDTDAAANANANADTMHMMIEGCSGLELADRLIGEKLLAVTCVHGSQISRSEFIAKAHPLHAGVGVSAGASVSVGIGAGNNVGVDASDEGNKRAVCQLHYIDFELAAAAVVVDKDTDSDVGVLGAVPNAIVEMRVPESHRASLKAALARCVSM
jgi:hypothetical protein